MSLSLGLKTKIGLPMVVLALVLGLAGLTLLSARVDSLKSAFVNMLAQDRVSAVRNALSTAADTALKEAAMFSSLPEVAAAYRLAHSGDMNDPKSPAAQAARERIREILAPVRAGLKTNLDADFKLHYHLPNGRSLVRIWRAKQAKKEGKWVDISDDLSGFRQTVLDINAKPEPLKGIEPGRGGFSIRGLAPVRDVDGGVLGSVEMLVDFDAVLGPFQAEPGVSVMVFMDEKLLNITTRLQDPAKYPVLDGGFVFVSGQDVPDAAAIATPALLGEGAQRVVVRTVGSRAVAAFPIEDYRGRRVGVLLVAQDITGPLAILANLSWVLKVSLVLVILAPLLVGMALMQRTVFSRIKRIEAFARSVAQGDLDGELDCRGSDEMAGIGRAVRSIPRSLKSLLADYETLADGVRTGDFLRHADASGYSGAFARLLESGNTLAEMFRNLFDAMPAPVMAIDRDRRVVYANPAAAAMTGLPVEKVQGRECHSLFRTQDCGSERCACVKAMRSRRAERSATASGEGQERLDFEYMALPLTGRDGTVVGALEVVMDQTVIRRVQRRIEDGVQHIDD
ncbi:MAG: cache domain-containing protein, partial [Desulfovibrionaceae bacterium]